MSEDKRKEGIEPPKTKEDASSESRELGPESLEGVVGGMMPAIPGVPGAAPLPGAETPVCISQS
jgi:hypothetical protein